MSELQIYYATNRRHVGADRWQPKSYGTDFSQDGMENLRFGRVRVEVDPKTVDKHLRKASGVGEGDGEALADYLAKQAKKRTTTIEAYREKDLQPGFSEANQPKQPLLGSKAMFAELQQIMARSKDVLVYVHGFNVDWHAAVGSALALQEMLRKGDQDLAVVMFTWPSNGEAYPFLSYKSDRADATASGGAVGRAILKLRDFLVRLHQDTAPLCDQELHVLCHSMGNFVLQNALARIAEFSPGPAMPRIFEHVFLCAPDVDDDALEPGKGMGRLHEVTRHVTVYFNTGDAALRVSDYTKGNPDRLGTAGSARPAQVHAKVHQVDCSALVEGWVEHGYYLAGRINEDIRQSIAGLVQQDSSRNREASPRARNSWVLR